MSESAHFYNGGPLNDEWRELAWYPASLTAWQHRTADVVEIGGSPYGPRPASFHGSRQRDLWEPHVYVRDGQSCSYRYTGRR